MKIEIIIEATSDDNIIICNTYKSIDNMSNILKASFGTFNIDTYTDMYIFKEAIKKTKKEIKWPKISNIK